MATGIKYDQDKPCVNRGMFAYFPKALLEVAKVSDFGAQKYERGGWKTVPDGIERYFDALGRHLLNFQIEGTFDKESGLRHMAHLAWNALAVLELQLQEDNKPKKESKVEWKKRAYKWLDELEKENM